MPVLSCLLYRSVSSLMKTLEGECPCLCESSINVNKLLTLLLFVDFVYVCPCRFIVAYLDLYGRYIPTTIILLTRNVSSYKTDWILSEFPLSWSRMLSWNFYKCKQVVCSIVVACLLDYFHACLLLYAFLILMLLVYFCLFVDHVNKPVIFVSGAFVYHFIPLTADYEITHSLEHTLRWFFIWVTTR